MDVINQTITLIPVEVAYATPEKQRIIALEVPEGTTAYEAVVESKITDEFKGIDLEKDPMGIFSRLLDGKGNPGPKEYELQARDRVEIYRPLIIDPKQARLKRADKAADTRSPRKKRAAARNTPQKAPKKAPTK